MIQVTEFDMLICHAFMLSVHGAFAKGVVQARVVH